MPIRPQVLDCRYFISASCLLIIETNERNRTMSWDEAYSQLQQELGREPDSGEVQQKMLEIAEVHIE